MYSRFNYRSYWRKCNNRYWRFRSKIWIPKYKIINIIIFILFMGTDFSPLQSKQESNNAQWRKAWWWKFLNYEELFCILSVPRRLKKFTFSANISICSTCNICAVLGFGWLKRRLKEWIKMEEHHVKWIAENYWCQCIHYVTYVQFIFRTCSSFAEIIAWKISVLKCII